VSAYRDASPELGPLLQELRPQLWVARSLFGVMIGTGALVDLIAIIGGASLVGGSWPIVILGAVVPGLGVLGLVSKKPERLRLHAAGLIVGEGSRAQTVLYDQISELRTFRVMTQDDRPRALADRHSLRLTDGRTVEIRYWGAALETIAKHLRAVTRERRLREARENLDAGVRFGEITVGAAGVRTEFAELTWSSIVEASLETATPTVVVRGKGSGWIELKLEEVPNAHVLVALVNERRGG
jgi:hypothetical protein